MPTGLTVLIHTIVKNVGRIKKINIFIKSILYNIPDVSLTFRQQGEPPGPGDTFGWSFCCFWGHSQSLSKTTRAQRPASSRQDGSI